MMENIQIQNGDMVSLARVVNENTSNLDKRIEGVVKQCNFVFNDVDERLLKLEKRTALNAKTLGKIGFAILLLDGVLLLNDRRIKKLNERIKGLEDQILVDKFFKKEDEEDSLK